jgi:hypothetical protein
MRRTPREERGCNTCKANTKHTELRTQTHRTTNRKDRKRKEKEREREKKEKAGKMKERK